MGEEPQKGRGTKFLKFSERKQKGGGKMIFVLNLVGGKTLEKTMTLLDVSEDRYYKALKISEDNDFQIHFWWSPKSCCFINNYFKTVLESWNSNMDLQPVLNKYKAINYKCACSQTMKHALRESIEKKLGNYGQMCAVAYAESSE